MSLLYIILNPTLKGMRFTLFYTMIPNNVCVTWSLVCFIKFMEQTIGFHRNLTLHMISVVTHNIQSKSKYKKYNQHEKCNSRVEFSLHS